MTLDSKPPSEVAVDEALVRALLVEQHPDLADLHITNASAGWDNHLFRLGDQLAVRLPRRALAADLVRYEHRWLPKLGPRLPLPIPVPVRLGRPGCGYPWSWSVVPWFVGASAAAAPLSDPTATAAELGRFLRALHQVAPADAPRNPWRGVPLVERTPSVLERTRLLAEHLDTALIVTLWEGVVSTPPWPGPSIWLHGDLHPGNILVRNGCLSAVLDFGDLTSGDPATDLSIAWMLLPPSARPTFRVSSREASNAIDDDTWMRARGWALLFGLVLLGAARHDAAAEAVGRVTIDAVLRDDA